MDGLHGYLRVNHRVLARVLLLPRKTSPLYKIGKFRHLLAYIGRFVFPIREPGRLYQNRESPGEIGRLERPGNTILLSLRQNCVKILSFVYFYHSTCPGILNKNNKIGQHQYNYSIQHRGIMLHIHITFELILCITYGYP